jgi:hypothetical protein
MSGPEIHLLDDIADELVEKKLRQKRVQIALIGAAIQITFIVVLMLNKHYTLRFHGFFVGWFPILIGAASIALQSRYRSPAKRTTDSCSER